MKLVRLAVLGATAMVARQACAQTDEAGASFLRVPIGARSVGMGGAGVADPSPAASMLTNPASLTRPTRSLVSLDYGQDGQSNRYLAFAAMPSRVLGTFAVGAHVFNPGEQPLTDDAGNVTGTLFIRDVAFVGSYAAMFGKRFSAGLSYKYLQNRFDCTGQCSELARSKPSTGAVDFGAQLDLGDSSAFHLGATVRNLGLKLQIKDRAQSDPLPTQIAVGAAWDVPNVARYVPDASLRLVADASTGLSVRLANTFHIGVEGIYRHSFALRAGYAQLTGYGGPAVGFGLMSKRFSLDVARQIAGEGLLADKPPTYAGLRYSF